MAWVFWYSTAFDIGSCGRQRLWSCQSMGFFEEWLERGFSLPGWGLEFCYSRSLFGASYQNNVSHIDQTIHPTCGYRASKSLPCQRGHVGHPRRCFR